MIFLDFQSIHHGCRSKGWSPASLVFKSLQLWIGLVAYLAANGDLNKNAIPCYSEADDAARKSETDPVVTNELYQWWLDREDNQN